MTNKMIINGEVEFKENEAWDGSIDKKIFIGVVIPQEEDEAEEHISQGGHQGSQTQSPIRDIPTRTTRNCVQGESSILVAWSTPTSQSRSAFDSTISSIRSRKTRNLREIYEDLNVYSNLALFACQPTFFEEAIKE